MSASPYHPRSSLKKQARNRDFRDLLPFPNFFIHKEELPIICKCIFDGADFLVLNSRDISTLYHNGAFGVSRVTRRDPLADQRGDTYKHQPYFKKSAFLLEELVVQPNYRVPVCDQVDRPSILAEAAPPTTTTTDETMSSTDAIPNNNNNNSTTPESSQKNLERSPKVQRELNPPSSTSPSSNRKVHANVDDKEQDVLVLMPEEVIFLTFGVGCLSVYDSGGKSLSYENIWNMLVMKNPEFPIFYAVYHHFRCKNWVPKNGHSFGGDYLLYEYGPSFSHATYVVHIFGSARPDPTWMEVYARNRCAAQSSKLALLCRVSTPKNFVPSSPMSIFQLSIQETTIRRWKPTDK